MKKRLAIAIATLGIALSGLGVVTSPAQATYPADDDCLSRGYTGQRYDTSGEKYVGEAGSAVRGGPDASGYYFVNVQPAAGYAISLCFFRASQSNAVAEEAVFAQAGITPTFPYEAPVFYVKWVKLDEPPADTWTATKLEANRVNVKQDTVVYDEYEATVSYVTPFNLETWTWPTSTSPWTFTQQVTKTATITTAPDGTITAVPNS